MSAPGEFTAGPYAFVVDDGFAIVELGDALCELTVEDLDARLVASERVPDLGSAPLASWLLARLHALTGGGLGLGPDRVELIDGGVFVLDFVVRAGGADVGKVQLQAGMIGAGLLGVLASVDHAAPVVQALLEAVLRNPDRLGTGVVQIRDPDWDEAPDEYVPSPGPEAACRYGFDGRSLVGADNVRPRA